MIIRVFLHRNLEIPQMPTSVIVSEPSASVKFSKGFSRTAAKGGVTAAFGLLVALALVLLAGANIYLNYLVGPTDMTTFLEQFVAP
jgi:hypothetical protein